MSKKETMQATIYRLKTEGAKKRVIEARDSEIWAAKCALEDARKAGQFSQGFKSAEKHMQAAMAFHQALD